MFYSVLEYIATLSEAVFMMLLFIIAGLFVLTVFLSVYYGI